MKIDYKGKIVVITGGSSGIGLATAMELARQHAILILIARNKERLHQAKIAVKKVNANAAVDTYAVDISVPEEITPVISEIGSRFGRIDLLINCAGMVTCGRFKDQSNEDLDKVIQINYMGCVYVTKAAWPYLQACRGQLSFVSSVAGYFGVIGYSSYSPSKFAMTGLAEVLRYEGKTDGISVSIIYPPNTATPLLDYSNKNNIPECLALSKNIKTKTAGEVAKIYVKGLQKNVFEIYCDKESKALRWLKCTFPSLSYRLSLAMIKRAIRAR